MEKKPAAIWRSLFNLPFLFTALLLGLFVLWFGVYYSQASSLISNQAETVSAQEDKLARLEMDLATATDTITGLQKQLSNERASVATLAEQVTLATSEAATLRDKLSSANAQLAELKIEVNNLRTVGKLAASTLIVNQRYIEQSAGAESDVASFTVEYAGYVVVSGTSSTANSYVRVTDSFGGYPYNSYQHPFGMSKSVIVPVLPGTVTVHFGNSNLTTETTAVLSVKYVY